MPEITGATVLRGAPAAAAAIAAVGAESAEVGPSPFDAVTMTSTVFPTSAAMSAYVVPVAPAIGAHAGVQRCHW